MDRGFCRTVHAYYRGRTVCRPEPGRQSFGSVPKHSEQFNDDLRWSIGRVDRPTRPYQVVGARGDSADEAHACLQHDIATRLDHGCSRCIEHEAVLHRCVGEEIYCDGGHDDLMTQFTHRYFEVLSAAPVMTLDAELLVANGIAGGDDQVVDAIGPVLDKIKHRLAEAT